MSRPALRPKEHCRPRSTNCLRWPSNYPDLKASGNFLELQQQMSDLENELQMARRYYNGTVRNLNVLVQSFPSNLMAGLFGFAACDYFELSDAGERAAPQVELAPR